MQSTGTNTLLCRLSRTYLFLPWFSTVARFPHTTYQHVTHRHTKKMDGIHPQNGRQQAKRNSKARGAAVGAGGGGLPAAPGAALDPELVHQIVASTQAPPSRVQQQQQHVPGLSETSAPGSTIASQPFDVFVVLDFEATCEQGRRIADPEVIEFPMVLVDARTAQPVAEFQRYVQPVRHPTLSDFCTELTGITQAMVEGKSTFPAVYREALEFLARAGLGDAPPLRSYCIVTCGDWDLKVMLPAQLAISGQLGLPASFQRWCNLKKLMERLNIAASPSSSQRAGRGRAPSGMPEMLRVMGLPLQGRHHSGIDDCRNIAAVLCALLKQGYVVDVTYDMAGAAATTRWHAPLQQPSGAQLPLLTSLTSSRADGSLARDEAPAVLTEAPPRAQVPREEPTFLPSTTTAAAAAATAPHRRVLRIDTNRNAVEELLRDSAASFPPEEHKATSKFLAKLLRHKADEWHVPISANGYVLVDDALRQPQLAKKKLTLHDVAVLVRDSDKQRFRLAFGADDGRLYIAAAQGQSLEGVEPELRVLTTPDEVPVAVHGTYWRAWRLIEACGYISPMTRHHIHFAKGLVYDDNVISGMRRDVELFVYLNVPAVLADGIPLYESSNGVILTPGVRDTRQLPLKYVAKVVDRQSGHTIYPAAAAAGAAISH